jgi:hypothetical protein
VQTLRLGGLALVVELLPIDHQSRGPPSTLILRPLPPLDTLFFSALFFAMGWAIVEVIFSSKDFIKKMNLYDQVLLNEDKLDEETILGRKGNHTSARDEYEDEMRQAEETIARAEDEEELRLQQKQHLQYGAASTSASSSGVSNSTNQNDELERQQQLPPRLNYSEHLEEIEDYFIEREERDLEIEDRIREIEREQFEEMLGVELFEIPVVITIIWRIDS